MKYKILHIFQTGILIHVLFFLFIAAVNAANPPSPSPAITPAVNGRWLRPDGSMPLSSSTLGNSLGRFFPYFNCTGKAKYGPISQINTCDSQGKGYCFEFTGLSPIFYCSDEKWGSGSWLGCNRFRLPCIRNSNVYNNYLQLVFVPNNTPTPSPSITPSPIHTPSPTPFPGTCPESAVWDGTKCKPITYQGETAIIGLDTPIANRLELKNIENSFTKRSIPNFPEELFDPDTLPKARQIQDLRLLNWIKNPDGTYERSWEFLISLSAKAQLDQGRNTIGTDAITFLIKHAEAANDIWTTAVPSINRRAVLKRIMILGDSLLSDRGGGWQITNDDNFSFWGNDTLNGQKGLAPIDVDSRWAWAPNYAQAILRGGGYIRLYKGMTIDFGLIHELTHQLPVGDNYTYNPGYSGYGISLLAPAGRRMTFTPDSIPFMLNDHMQDPTNLELTAPDSHAINYFWTNNPKFARNPQHNPYIANEQLVFFPRLNIKVTGLERAGITSCAYLKESAGTIPDTSITVTLVPSSEYQNISFSNGECRLVLSDPDQNHAFPGGYIGLTSTEGFTFPLYLPRNLFASLYQANMKTGNTEYYFTLETTSAFSQKLSYYFEKIRSGSGIIYLGPYTLWHYMKTVSPANLPADTITYGTIDDLNNQYIIELRNTPIFATPTPTATPLPAISILYPICDPRTGVLTVSWTAQREAINYQVQSWNSHPIPTWYLNQWLGGPTPGIILNNHPEEMINTRVAWTNDRSYNNISPFSPVFIGYCPLPSPTPTLTPTPFLPSPTLRVTSIPTPTPSLPACVPPDFCFPSALCKNFGRSCKKDYSCQYSTLCCCSTSISNRPSTTPAFTPTPIPATLTPLPYSIPSTTPMPANTPIPTNTPVVIPTLSPTSTPGITIPGDANRDGIIDGIDYTIWLQNYGKTLDGGPTAGDFNNDGRVDDKDLDILIDQMIL